MPYITKEQRSELDTNIMLINAKLEKFDDSAIEGALNYTITSLLTSLKRGEGKKWRYMWINRVVGTLECVKQEFYRRLAGPYEDTAIQKNGDISIYDE